MSDLCPLVHNYSVITELIGIVILHGPKITKRLTVNVCLSSN